VKLKDIEPGRWYATSFGIGECVGISVEYKVAKIKINERIRSVMPRDVFGEAKRP
jgi:hypothetical protein